MKQAVSGNPRLLGTWACKIAIMSCHYVPLEVSSARTTSGPGRWNFQDDVLL